ncbi:hypothetical protein PHMEG_00031235, partial [Phytophthora megakarya]
IMSTVKQMEERGEKLEEATPEEILEAASKAAETVFKFDFSISDANEAAADDANAKKRSRNRKRNKKRRGKKQNEDKSEATTAVPVTPEQRSTAKDAPQKKQSTGSTGSSFLKLRKATGTDSEVAKMHLRYGQGRRNMAAMKQREQRKKPEATNSDFKFNFAAS